MNKSPERDPAGIRVAARTYCTYIVWIGSLESEL